MAIKGKQVPMYTKHKLFFVFFWFFIFFYEKKNKANLKTNKQKHVKQSMHKTRLTQK